MNQKLRRSGIDFIGDVPWGTHFCQFYQTKEDLTDILVPYFKAGLENNEFCMWITSSPLDAEEAKEALRRTIPDFDVYLEKEQIEIIPCTYWHVKEAVFNSERILNGWVEKLNQALESGYEGLRLAENTSWLEKEYLSDFVEYEKKVDAIISSCHLIALCTYSLDVHDLTEAIGIVANHQFTLVKKKGKWEKIESSNRQNITEHKRAEEALRQSEQSVGLKLESILSPAREIANLALVDIVDAQAIQSLMDDFYKLTHIPVGLIDLKGNILVGAGWQDICTKFHRVHPEACKHCVESDTKLSAGVLPGKFKLYRCKNNMWDIATPIIVGGQHVGNIFLGQFFFEGEPLDYELFQSQARKYGFNEDEYIAALEKVPRLSREAVNTIMVFFMKLANMLSQLGYSNIKLSQSLAERDTLVEALRESEKRERARSDELAVLLDAVPAAVWVAHDPQALKVTGNRLSHEWIRIPEGTNSSKSAPEGEKSETFRVFKDGVEIPPVDMPVQMSAAGIEINDYEFDLIYPEGVVRHLLGNARPLRDEKGNPRGSVSAFIDITERKKAEEALKKAHENLEEKVKERTTQLEKAYSLLKESERGLAEAQRMAHIGNWEWDIVNDKAYWSEEMYRIFERDPQESVPPYNEHLSYVHPEDRDYVDNAIKKVLKGEPYSIDNRIITANGEERAVHAQSEVIFDEKNIPIRVKGIVQDITERKRAEEKIQTLANAVESSNDAIVTESLEGIILSWNKGAEHVYGYSAEDILGKDISILEPDNTKGEIKQFSEKIKQGEKIQHYETSRLRRDGTTINVSVTLSPVFNTYKKLVAISGISRDITEIKREKEDIRKSEERYRLITEQTGQLIYDFYFKEDKISWAGAIEEITGYSPEEFQNFDFSMWVERIHPKERERVEKTIAEARKKGKKFQEEYSFRRKNGYYIYVSVVGTYLLDEKGQSYRVVGVVKDITERKEAEKALANIEIARKKEIHHRIKNNLQVISSLLDLQAENFSNRKCIKDSDVLNAFRESQNRIMSIALIHEELHEGRVAGKLNFSSYLEKLIENLFKTYRLGNVDLNLSMDLEENIFFDMDTAVPLGLIVNEIVSNSLKYAFPDRDKGEIQIKLFKEKAGNELSNGEEELAGKGTGYTLIVSDDGVGIPDKIDLENSDTLGLQLVNILVDQLYGEIKLKRDIGTEFNIRINV
ncbi:PAS domain S-box protein [Methanosarcina sp. 1.H.A.2.2]|uniref:PAS domain S-box protein n=1 Tax=Methanosarcina sp. 1.H.A.2.2 TaxID=1483601 RepID=UPI00064F8E2F|nr:PAS domain S-box protein [Methanosarcina sp. 1.H.A.2.2]